MPTDNEVATWTSNVLQQTITVDYKQLEAQDKSRTVRQYYSGQAWSGLGNFFGSIIPQIIKYKERTNPIPAGPPIITDKGQFNGMPFWKVSQTFHFPEIDKYVWFSVIVIPNTDPPLIIESLNMKMDM
jgi:hypothetical protein